MMSVEALPTKRCTKCSEVLVLDEFHKRAASKDGLSPKCKTCDNTARREHKRKKPHLNKASYRKSKANNERVQSLVAYKENNPCARCGGKFLACQMDLDHLPGTVKLFHVTTTEATCTNKWSDEQWQEELDKCQLLCANCHRLTTWERANDVEC